MAYELKGKRGYESVDNAFGSASGVVKSVDTKTRTIHLVGTNENPDRDKDVIMMNGWDLDKYRDNPVFLWGHDRHSVPIGAAIKIIKRREPKQLEFIVRAPSEQGVYPFADMIFSLYKDKIINACSVGFIAKKSEPIVPENSPQGTAAPANPFEGFFSYNGRRFLEQELVELSGCTVPSNPSSLQRSMEEYPRWKSLDDSSKGILTNLLLGNKTPDVDEKNLPRIMEDLQKMMKSIELEDETSPTLVQVPKNYGFAWEDSDGNVYQEELKFEESEMVTKDDVLKPYPNEHACRIKDPENYDSFARKSCYKKSGGKCIDFIFGIKEGTSELQALRFKKEVWNAEDAKKYCQSKKGRFEASKEAEGNETVLGTVADLTVSKDSEECSECTTEVKEAKQGIRNKLKMVLSLVKETIAGLGEEEGSSSTVEDATIYDAVLNDKDSKNEGDGGTSGEVSKASGEQVVQKDNDPVTEVPNPEPLDLLNSEDATVLYQEVRAIRESWRKK